MFCIGLIVQFSGKLLEKHTHMLCLIFEHMCLAMQNTHSILTLCAGIKSLGGVWGGYKIPLSPYGNDWGDTQKHSSDTQTGNPMDFFRLNEHTGTFLSITSIIAIWRKVYGPIGSLINRSTCSHTTNFLFPPNFCGSMVLQSVFICKTEQWKLEVPVLPGSLSGVLGNKENDQVIICSNKTVKFLI